MSRTALANLLELLRPVSGMAGVRQLLMEIEGDLRSLNQPTIALAGPDFSSLENLREAVLARRSPNWRVTAFEPYRSVVEWPAGMEMQMRRCTALVAMGFARQFMPRMLSELVAAATATDAVVVILVDGLGRVRDPEALKEALSNETASYGSPCRVTLSFLTDGNYEGETCMEVVRHFVDGVMADREETQQRQAERFYTLHHASARSLLESELASLQNIQETLTTAEDKAQGVAEVFVMSLESIPAHWANEGYALTDRIHDVQAGILKRGTNGADKVLQDAFNRWCEGVGYRSSSKISDYSQQALRLLRLPPNSAYADTLSQSLAGTEQAIIVDIAKALDVCSHMILTGRAERKENTSSSTNLLRLTRIAIEDRYPWHRPDLKKKGFEVREEREAEELRQDGESFRDSAGSVLTLAVDRVLNVAEQSRIEDALTALKADIKIVVQEHSAALTAHSRRWAQDLMGSVMAQSSEARRSVEQQSGIVRGLLERL